MLVIVETLRQATRPLLTVAARQAAGNLFGLGLISIGSNVVGTVVTLLLVQSLSQAEYGAFATALSLQSYMLILGNFGSRPVILREAVRRPDKIPVILCSHFAVSVAGGLFVFFASFIAVWFIPVSSEERWVLLILACGNIAACAQLQPLFDARHRQSASGAIVFLGELTGLLALALMYCFGLLNLLTIAIVYALKWLIVLMAQWNIYVHLVGRVYLRFQKSEIVDTLRSSAPLAVAWLAAAIPPAAGIVIVRYSAGADSAAIFGIAQYVGQAYVSAGNLGVSIFQPHIIGVYGLTRSFLCKGALFFTGYLGLLAILFCGAAVTLIPWFLTPNYEPSIPLAIAFIAGGVLSCVANIACAYAIALHFEKLLPAIYIAVMVLFLGIGSAHLWTSSLYTLAIAYVASQLACVALVGCVCYQVWPSLADDRTSTKG